MTIGENNHTEHCLVKKKGLICCDAQETHEGNSNPSFISPSSQYRQNTGEKLVSMRRSNQADKRPYRREELFITVGMTVVCSGLISKSDG